MAIIKTYRQQHGSTTEARLTTVVQAACEAATVLPWEWRKSRVLPVAEIRPVSPLIALAPSFATLLQYASLRGSHAFHASPLRSLSLAIRRDAQRWPNNWGEVT